MYRVADPTDADRPWEAVLPVLQSRGRASTNVVFAPRSLGFFPSVAERGAASLRQEADAAKAAPGSEVADDLLRDPIMPLIEQPAGGFVDFCAVFKAADMEDREDGHREPLELIRSHKSESGFKGVHKSGADKWQVQVYYNGQLWHVGHNPSPEISARTMAVCQRLIDNLRRRGIVDKDAVVSKGGRRKTRDPAMELGRAPELRDLEQFDEELDLSTGEALKVHTNKSAMSGCQGVFFHQSLGMFGVVAPGKFFLGYFPEVKPAAVCFSKHVAAVASTLGRKYATRPWPRLKLDQRRYHPLTLTSCGLTPGDEPAAADGGGSSSAAAADGGGSSSAAADGGGSSSAAAADGGGGGGGGGAPLARRTTRRGCKAWWTSRRRSTSSSARSRHSPSRRRRPSARGGGRGGGEARGGGGGRGRGGGAARQGRGGGGGGRRRRSDAVGGRGGRRRVLLHAGGGAQRGRGGSARARARAGGGGGGGP